VGSHRVTYHPAVTTFPPLSHPKLELDLATPEGSKAKFTWVVVISQDSLPAKNGHLFQKNWAVLWPETEDTMPEMYH